LVSDKPDVRLVEPIQISDLVEDSDLKYLVVQSLTVVKLKRLNVKGAADNFLEKNIEAFTLEFVSIYGG